MNYLTNRIVAQDYFVSNDTRKTGLNNNDLIVGPPGSSKTRGYVIPNILQCGESLIVTDTKGNLQRQLGDVLKRSDYAVLELDLADCAASPNGYDPLDYIRVERTPVTEDEEIPIEDFSGNLPSCSIQYERCKEQDVMTVAAALVPIENQKDPFWDYATRGLLASLIAYVVDCLPPQERTMESILELFYEVRTGGYDALIRELAETDPDSMAVSQDGQPAEPHIHAMICFENACHITSIAKKLGIEPQYIAKWDGKAANGYAYLLHATDKAKREGKHPYD